MKFQCHISSQIHVDPDVEARILLIFLFLYSGISGSDTPITPRPLRWFLIALGIACVACRLVSLALGISLVFGIFPALELRGLAAIIIGKSQLAK